MSLQSLSEPRVGVCELGIRVLYMLLRVSTTVCSLLPENSRGKLLIKFVESLAAAQGVGIRSSSAEVLSDV